MLGHAGDQAIDRGWGDRKKQQASDELQCPIETLQDDADFKGIVKQAARLEPGHPAPRQVVRTRVAAWVAIRRTWWNRAARVSLAASRIARTGIPRSAACLIRLLLAWG